MKLRPTILGVALVSILAVSCSKGKVRPIPTNPVKAPLMGWSTWNAYGIHISDSIVMHQADLIVSLGLKDAGYNHVNIDDGFFGYRDEEGYMIPHAEKFPNGMKPVADYIHSLGMLAGIYSDAGDNSCASLNGRGDPHGMGAGLYLHDRQDITRYFNDWGYDFIKIDYCGGRHQYLLEEPRFREIRKNLDELTGRHIEMNVCRWVYPGEWAREVGESWRVSADIRPWWSSISEAIGMNLYMSAYAGEGHYNDMDMLVIGYSEMPSRFFNAQNSDREPLTYIEEEAHFGMWCIMSSPLAIGCDLEYLPARALALMTNPELIAVDQDPLGLQAYVVQHEGEGYVLVKDIEVLKGPARAVALYNPSDEPVDFTVPLEVLEYSGKVTVRDLLRGEDLGTMTEISMTVPAHGAKILRLEGKKRIEPTIYEAEWAYNPAYAESNFTPCAKPVPYVGASCGVAVDNLVGYPQGFDWIDPYNDGTRQPRHSDREQCLIWDDVYSAKGGSYTLSVRCTTPQPRTFILDVNGTQTEVQADAAEGFVDYPVEVKLSKGFNTVKISNLSGPAPVMDCFTLEKI